MRLAAIALAAALSLAANAKGILPSMVQRHGLTNAQIDYILERTPDAELRLTRQDWRAIRFEVCRYRNVTNWVAKVMGQDDFAAMLLSAQEATNTLSAALARIRAKYAQNTNVLARLGAAYDELDGQYATATGLVASVRAKLQTSTAELEEDAKELEEEIADLDEKIEDSKYLLLRTWLKTQRSAKATRLELLRKRIDALGD